MRKNVNLIVIMMAFIPIPLISASEVIADYVLTDAKVYTSNPNNPWAKTIAIKNKDIIYVGDSDNIERFTGEHTKIARLKGRVVLPGLISTHEHPLLVMGVSSGLMMENRADKEYMMNSLKGYLEKQPQGPYLSFGGAYEGMVDISRKDIDKIVSDTPFVMVASSGHGGWVNSKALEAIGILKGGADPIDYFERDKDGVPTGYVGTSAAIFHVISKLGIIDKQAILNGADDIFGLFRSQGITSVYDAGVTIGLEGEAFSAIHELENQNKLTMRISASAAFAQRPIHINAAKQAMKKYGKMYNSELFRISTLKIHGDGDWGGYTVGMLKPFDTKPDSVGMVSFPDQNQLNGLMLDAARLGYDLHVHIGGDRTARMVLNGFDAVRKAGFKNTRLTSGHTTLVDPKDKPRFKELDVIVNTFATDIAVDHPGWREAIGEERYKRLQPMKSFVNDGVKVVCLQTGQQHN